VNLVPFHTCCRPLVANTIFLVMFTDPERERGEAYLRQLRDEVTQLKDGGVQIVNMAPETPSEICTCAVMERDIMEMAQLAYKSVRRRDSSPEGFELFKLELIQTNKMLKDSLEVLKAIKECCEHTKRRA
jgi:hypothetical protein